MHYYEIAPIKLFRPDSGAFTYSNKTPIDIGQLVKIEVGKKSIIGVNIKKVQKPTNYNVKEIEKVLDNLVLPTHLVETALWISEYYSTHLSAVLSMMVPSGLEKNRRLNNDQPILPKRSRTNYLLNLEQQSAVNNIADNEGEVFILQGITGSGKTAVYIELAKQTLESGRSVIVMVPEIGLTSQIVAEFSNHFTNIVQTNSSMSEATRHEKWLQVISSLDPNIVIGPRSALFMPIDNIGLIIIDECHDQSYKQDKSPKYSALRVATILGKLHKAKIIFGSATPNVEDRYLAEKFERPIIKLKNSAISDSKQSNINIVDSKNKQNYKKHRFLSDKLIYEIDETLKQRKQALIYHNRRGSASVALCKDCGWSATCPNCHLPLTLHSKNYELVCHVCSHVEKVPSFCPSCSSADIIYKGVGTQLIESEIKKLFPNAQVARFDADNSKKDSLNNRYQDIYDGKIDIIIGTQILAKGLDLPNLRTVGIIQADSGLIIPDYNANEKVFQLITQTMGRVGRNNQETNVIVQTYQPNYYAIQSAIERDYESFYEKEIKQRKDNLFPPFTYLLKIVCIYKTESATINNIKKMNQLIKSQISRNVKIFGPAPAFYERINNKYHWQIIIKSSDRKELIAITKLIPISPHWQYDIDATSLL